MCTGRVHIGGWVGRKTGRPSNPNAVIGQAFYSPATAKDDGFFFFLLSKHLIYSLLLGCKENLNRHITNMPLK